MENFGHQIATIIIVIIRITFSQFVVFKCWRLDNSLARCERLLGYKSSVSRYSIILLRIQRSVRVHFRP